MRGLLTALLCLLLAAGAAQAQLPGLTGGGGGGGSSEEAPTEPLVEGLAITQAQAEDLLAVLQDEAARTQLVERLQALLALQESAAAEAEEDPAAAFVEEQAGVLLRHLRNIGRALQSVVEVAPGLALLAENLQERDRLTADLVDAALAIAVLLLVRWGAALAIRRPRRRLSARGEGASRLRKGGLVLVRLVIESLPVAALFAAFAAVGSLAPLGDTAARLTVALLGALATSGIVGVVARLLFAPDSPGLRLFDSSDERARGLFRWTLLITRTIAWGYFAIDALYALGLPAPARSGLLVLVGAAAAVLAVLFVLRNRRRIAHAIRRDRSEGEVLPLLRRLLADSWHLLALLYVLLFFLVFCADFDDGLIYMLKGTVLSAVILVFARLARKTLEGLGSRRSGKGRTLTVLLGAGRLLIAAVAAVLLLEAWEVDIFGLFETEFGARATSAIVSILLLLAGAVLIWKVAVAVLERQMLATDAKGQKIERSARFRTLMPLIRNAVLVLLVTFVGLMALSELGIDIAPLLAGAGVVGLAIGFGAQTLVQDVITGLFIVVEDQIHIGDVVDTGGHSGLVEGMTIRTLRLRDLSGTVHVIPFSQVTAVQNLTKDFSYYIFEVGVAYREDVDRVIEELKVLGKELRDDPDFGPLILADLEVLGLDKFADSAVVVKARFKTLPIQQWAVGREFNRRMKRRFDEKGIEIPFPHVTLYFGADQKGRAQPGFLKVDATTDLADPDAEEEEVTQMRPRRRHAKTSPQRGDEDAESSPGADD